MAKYFLLFVIVCVIIPSVSHAQTRAAKDSAEWAALKEQTEDSIYNGTNRFDTALLILAKKTVQKAASTFGDQSRNYGLSLSNLAFMYYHFQKYPLGEKIAKKAVAIIAANSGKNDTDYADALTNFASIEKQLGKYGPDVENSYKQALSIREKLFLTDSSDYGFEYLESLNNLGNYYCEIEKFSPAEKYIKQAVDLQFQSSGKDSEYAILENDLANIYLAKGDYATAEPLFRESFSILDSVAGKNFDFGNTLNNLATLYTAMNNYGDAINAHHEVMNIIIKLYHEKTSDYATTETKLAKLYINVGQYDSAAALLKEADTIYRKELNTDNILYAQTLNESGDVYLQQNNLTDAENNYIEAKEIIKKNLGTNSVSYAESLNSLGVLSIKEKNYSGAEKYLDSAKTIRLKILGNNNADYAATVNSILKISYAEKNNDDWQKKISYAITTWQNGIKNLLLSFDETQKENYLNNHLQQKDEFLSMLYYFQKPENTDSLNSVYFKLITALQGWLLTGSEQLNSLVTQQHNKNLLALYNKWILVKKQYTSAIQKSDEQQKEFHLDAASLLSQAGQMEMQLIDSLSTYKEILQNTGETSSAISKKLKNNEAFINWVSFKYTAPEKETDSVLYGAFIILPKDTVAHFVTLFEQSSLKKILSQYHNAAGRGIKLTAVSANKINADSLLYQLIWKPLLPYLGKQEKIYIISSGLLNKVSFAGMIDASGKTLLETTELHLLNNTGDFINPSEKIKTTPPEICIFGGANFNGKNNTSVENADESVFPYLPGTMEESDSLATLFTAHKWKVQLNTGFSASEENFKKLSGNYSPYILHIATHGFYIPANSFSDDRKNTTNSENIFADQSDFPLLRNGFVLSGANLFWNNDSIAAEGTDDGIVRAQEVSNLNFAKTSLVTLSACETALGDINNNEGVYGLQRAFKIAGVKNMLITLWQIPDEQTIELMNIFYKNVLRGDSYYISLRDAQIKMKKKYSDPAVWAGFELTGE